MKLIDFDGLFDEKLTQYMQENQEKHTEKQWENIIPKLYKKFGDTHIPKLGCTPKEYYARMTDEQLAQTICGHLQEDVPVPEFLCTEIENRDNADILLPLLKSEDCQTVSYAVNILGDNQGALDEYFNLLLENKLDEEVLSDLTDILRLHADEIKERALRAYQDGLATEYMLEILSRVQERDERVYSLLINVFLNADDTSRVAGYLGAYGDERALEVLLKKIEDRSIGFVEFQELKYAIESLGGEYNEPRDFSSDKDYLAVEVANAKSYEDEIKS